MADADPSLHDLSALGWSVLASPPPNASLEFTKAQAWKVARLWTRPTTLQSIAPSSGTHRIILSVEGDAEFRVGSVPDRLLLKPRQMMLFKGSDSVIVENRTLWAWYEWHLHSPMFLHTHFADYLSTPLDIEESYFQILASSANVICASPQISESPGQLMLAESLTRLIAAAIIGPTDVPSGLTPAQSAVFREAVRQIDEHYQEVGLSVAKIARLLSVSPAYLHRVFSLAGTTPRRELEIRRVNAANSLLSNVTAHGKGTAESIARQSGFPSAKRMQIAIRRRRDPR